MSDLEAGRNGAEWVTHRDPVSVGTKQWDDVLAAVAPLLETTVEKLLDTPGALRGDRMIGLNQIAAVAGVAKGTPIQWRQRTARGELTGDKAFPEPDDQETFPDKPMWRISTVVNYLIATRRWPPGAAGRPESRGPRGPRQPRVVQAELVS